ncbi:MAG: hypothetical protein J2P31_21565, partial [Blastocatellia bacterium]|nr:hypothetical protein [Blastocatellia bacterium]
MKHAIIMLSLFLGAGFARIVPLRQAPAQRASSSQTGRTKREGAITGRVIGPDGQPVADANVIAFRIGENDG